LFAVVFDLASGKLACRRFLKSRGTCDMLGAADEKDGTAACAGRSAAVVIASNPEAH
jgi:hypothetical protein